MARSNRRQAEHTTIAPDSSLSRRVAAHYETLTKSQRRLVDFILGSLDEAAFMSSSELAQRINVSEATVVRFAQVIGYDGYPRLRDQLQKDLLRHIRSSERVATMLTGGGDQSGPLQETLAQTIDHLRLLSTTISEADVAACVSLIQQARTVYIVAEGAPAAVTVQGEFWLARLGCRVQRVNQTGRRFFDQVFQAGEGDLGLVFVFRRAGPEATALIQCLHERNGKSILITDLETSSLHALATKVLLAKRGPMDAYRPLGAPVALMDAIILGLIQAEGERGVDLVRQLDDLRQQHGYL